MEQNLAEDLKRLQQYYFKKTIKEDAFQLLGGGFSSDRNYRLDHEGKTYFARFMSDMQSLAMREKECLVTSYVGKIGIGAKVYYQNPQQGIILTDFIQGRTANYDDMVNEPNRNLIVTNVKTLHLTEKRDFPKAKTIAIHIQDILKRADSTILQQQLQALELMAPLNSLSQYEKNNLTAALIHGDLHPDNILISKNRVYFIDWTDAGIGDPFADISRHALFFPLSLRSTLLQYYFDHIDTIMQQKLLCYYCLRLFRLAAWGVEEAKKISKDCEHLLIDIMGQRDLPEPYNLMVDLFSNKITLEKPGDFLLVSAIMLHYLSQFTKTDQFLSAIEDLSRHA